MDRHVANRAQAMGGGQHRARVKHERRAESRLARTAHQNHRHAVGEALIGRRPDKGVRRPSSRRDEQDDGEKHGETQTHGERPCAEIRSGSMALERSRDRSATTRSHCIQPSKR